MADDIDIEEHDLLDNPRIRNIFPDLSKIGIEENDLLDNNRTRNIIPDLSKVKIEVPDYDHDGTFIEHGYSNSRTEPLSTDSSPNAVGFKDATQQPTSSREAIQFEDAEVHYNLYRNKIIIGSKPSQPIVTIKEEIPSPERVQDSSDEDIGNEQVFQEDDGDIELEESMSHFGGIITPSVFILGSKSNNILPTVNSDFDLDAVDDVENDPKVFNSSVLLKDWGPRLASGNSYCKECETLFATRNALDVHNMAVHSFLVAVPSPNKAVKSTSKGISKNTTISGAPSTSKGKFCNHCNKYFMDDDKLIKHLYENLLKCNKCNKFFKTEFEFRDHMRIHDDENSDEEENSEFYKCALCSCYFKKKSRYVKHSNSYHNVRSMNLDLTRVCFSEKCVHCGSEIANPKSYNRHILNHHLELACNKPSGSGNKQSGGFIKLSGSRPPAIRRPPDRSPDNPLKKSDYKYRCRICKQIFISYYAARRHKKLKHPGFKQQHMLDKIRNKPVPIKRKPDMISKEMIESTVMNDQPKPSPNLLKEVNYSENVYKGVGEPPIPKTVLFKCNQCEINFTSCSAGVAHAKDCRQYKGEWKCQICQREFLLSDKKTHMSQHVVSERFLVYICVENLYGRVLCKCPDCKSFFHEQEFWSHYRHGCGKFELVMCDVCDFPINMWSIKIHNHWHKVLAFSDKDLIFVEFVHHNKKDEVNPLKDISQNSAKPNFKRKMEEPNDIGNADSERDEFEAPKQSKYNPTEKFTLYYCSICKVYVSTWRGAQMHLESKCKTAKLPHRKCKICGLTFVNYHHSSIHQGNRVVRLGDYKIIRIQDKKVINPPMPTYPKCRSCNTHFCTKTALSKHDCDDSHKMCPICKKSFSDLAYKLHMAFHQYGKSVTPKGAPKTQDIPELLKQYERLTRTWNVLYSCNTCDIVCDFYDKAVEHCQNHYSNMESYGMTIKKCLICKIKFDETCFGRHMELHNENVTINRDSFQILIYKYTALLSDDWFELFGTLPKPQVEQIVSRSVYNLSRNVKMTLIKEGSPEFTLYKCGTCEKFVNPQTVSEHHKYVSCSKEKRHTFCCTVCKIPFSSYSGMSQHKNTHRISSESCRVVLFNTPGDEEFNRALKVDIEDNANNKLDANRKRALKRTHDKIARNPSYTFYKCERCQCCGFQRKIARSHLCGSAVDRMKCPKCGFYIKKKGLPKHLALHKAIPDLVRRNIKLVSYTPRGSEIDGEEKTFKLFKCRCGLHFTSMKSIEEHFKVCRPECKVSKENCSKCGLLFATAVLVSHLCSHHKNDEHSNFDVVQVTPKVTQLIKTSNARTSYTATQKLVKDKSKACLFKCVQCNIHYLKYGSLGWHIHVNHRVKCKVVSCTICGLNFTSASVTKHILIHHQNLRCKRKDFKIVTQKPEAGQALVKPTTSDKKAKVNVPFPWSEKYLSSLDLKNYSHILYKCHQCSLHFITKNAYITHNISGEHTDRSAMKCTECNLIFGHQTIKKHEYIHHNRLKLNRKDFEIKEQGERTQRNSKKDDTNNERVTQINDELDASSPGPMSEYESDSDTTITNETRPAMKPPKLTKGEKTRVHLKNNVRHFNRNKPKLQEKKQDESQPYQWSQLSLSTLNLNRYSKQIYKCNFCGLHFLAKGTVVRHLKRFEEKEKHIQNVGATCPVCGLLFSQHTLSKHIYVHHKKMKLKQVDFQIFGAYREKGEDKIIYTVLDNKITHEESKYSNDNNELDETRPNIIDIDQSDSVSTDTDDCETTFKPVLRNKTPLKKGSIENIKSTPTYKMTKRLLQYHSKTIYKCSSCCMHFITKRTSIRHDCLYGNRKQNNNDVIECSTCGLAFRNRTYKWHASIHHDKMKLKREDFKIIVLEMGNNSENNAKADRETTERDHDESNNDQPYESSSNITDHDTERTLNNNSSNATTPIPDDNTDSKKNLRLRVIKTTTNNIFQQVDLTKKLKKYNLYKCNDCDVHFVTESSLGSHISRVDHEIPKVTCADCGFAFTLRSLAKHKNLHHKRVKLQAEDFHIVYKKRDTPTKLRKYLPKKMYNNNNARLYRCDICSLNFLRPHSLEWHIMHSDHDIDKVKCDLCGFMFSKISLDQHKSIHHEEMKVGKEDFRICRLVDIQNKNSNENTTYDEKSLNSSNDTNSIHDLGLASSSVPQNMISAEETGSVLIEDVQPDNTVIENIESFITVNDNTIVEDVLSIVKHDYLNGDVISENEKRSVTTDGDHEKTSDKDNINNEAQNLLPIFNISGDIDLGKYNNILYKCRKCGIHFLRKNSLLSHMRTGHRSNFSRNETKCSRCGLLFTIHTLTRHNYIHHEQLNFKLEDFNILDDSSQDEESDTTDSDGTEEAANNDEGESVLHTDSYNDCLYKCTLCGSYFLMESAFDRHLLLGLQCHVTPKKKCSICGLKISTRSITRHISFHHDKMNMKLEDFKIVDKTPSRISKNENAEDKTDNNRTRKLAIAKIKLSNMYEPNLYKCSDCLLHFCSIGGLKRHLSNKDLCSLSSKSSCPTCGLAFANLAEHKFIHHEKMNLKIEDFNITSLPNSNENTAKPNEKKAEINKAIVSQSTISCEDVDSSVDLNSSKESEENDKSKNKKQITKLYKCGDCNVYFITQATCYKHVTKHKRLDSKDFIECKFCGFQFRIEFLLKHMKRHHSKDFNLENVLVEEYQPSVESNVTPKIDLYYAINKVQSRLVSTTTEPSKETNLSAETLIKPHIITLYKDTTEPTGTQSHNIEGDTVNTRDAYQVVILSSTECKENRGEASCIYDPQKEKLEDTMANTKQTLHVESSSDLTTNTDKENHEETMVNTNQTLHGELLSDLANNTDKEKHETIANTKQTQHGDLSSDLKNSTDKEKHEETIANTNETLHEELSSDLKNSTGKEKHEETMVNTNQTLHGELSSDLTNNTDKEKHEETMVNTNQTLHGELSSDLTNNTDKEKHETIANTKQTQHGDLSSDLKNSTDKEKHEETIANTNETLHEELSSDLKNNTDKETNDEN